MKAFSKMLVIVLIALLITGCTQNVTAATSNDFTALDDSLHISDDIRKQMKLKDTDFVIREYFLDIISSFSMDMDAKAAITSDEGSGDVYVVVSDGDVTCKWYINPDGSGLTKRERKYVIVESWDMDAIQEIMEGSAIKKISPGIQIHCVYYMRNLMTSEGAAVYYETDRGEFIYYSGAMPGEYLMPLSTFYKFADDFAANRIPKSGYVIGYHVDISETWSAYNVNSETFDPYAEPPGENNQIALWISLCVVLFSTGIVAVVLVYRRKRRTIIE